ncbi:sulfide dehydrogenase (Flavoprotein) subunit SudA, partial [Candidatus Magnetomorum sp. HK-1]
MPLDLKAIQMANRDPKKRAKNFDEVALGYTAEQAQAEAKRCLQCPTKPCIQGCPICIDIPRFIKSMQKADWAQALAIINEQNPWPAITGRVCPQEHQCQKKCIMGKKGDAIAIGKLERFVADFARNQKTTTKKTLQKPELSISKIAIVGSGPAGLACAAVLAQNNYEITIFEGFHKLGGVLLYGIPEFRLPKQIVEENILFL